MFHVTFKLNSFIGIYSDNNNKTQFGFATVVYLGFFNKGGGLNQVNHNLIFVTSY